MDHVADEVNIFKVSGKYRIAITYGHDTYMSKMYYVDLQTAIDDLASGEVYNDLAY